MEKANHLHGLCDVPHFELHDLKLVTEIYSCFSTSYYCIVSNTSSSVQLCKASYFKLRGLKLTTETRMPLLILPYSDTTIHFQNFKILYQGIFIVMLPLKIHYFS